MLQMRNYDEYSDFEYLLSPVATEDNSGVLKFFNSSYAENSSEIVAKKGLLLVNKIRNENGLNNLDLKVTDQEWISSVIGDKFPEDK